MHWVMAGHDTPLKRLKAWMPHSEHGRGAGLGVGWTSHAFPSQRSPRVAKLALPTAVQAATEGQETPARPLICVPGRSGVGWITHCAPSQRSPSIAKPNPPLAASRAPTAV